MRWMRPLKNFRRHKNKPVNDSYDKAKQQAKNWNKNSTQELSDSYIIKLLKYEGVNNPDKNSIELKRLMVRLKRLCKSQNK